MATLVDAPADALADLLDGASGRGVIPRGLGRSYGDPAQNGGGTVVRVTPTANPIWIDVEAGITRVDAGVSLDELLRHIVPHGFFVPVTPGTRFVTVGGAIAADIHGKNHHTDLTFGHHVNELDMTLADGSSRRVTPDDDLWWATLGGMGLTGLITAATIRLLPIQTSRCVVRTRRLDRLADLVDAMSTDDDLHRYSVAWVDMTATGARLGRSVLQQGDHATLDELGSHGSAPADDPLGFAPGSLATVPRVPNVMNRLTVRTFNELWFRKAPRDRTGLENIGSFFHPLDGVGAWNRFYGPAGFLQYQFVVPFEALDSLEAIIARVAASGHASAISVLKRFGPQSGGMLSFPMPGWTLTFDLAAGAAGLDVLLSELDSMVVAAGGRHYLAKDAHTTPESIRAGYPRLDEWKAVRRQIDPDGRFASDQARRLDLL